MTRIQQQRLLGAVLLLGLISVIAWLLLNTVEQNQPAPPREEPIVFDSVIEPIPILEEDEISEPADKMRSQAVDIPRPEPDLQASKNMPLPEPKVETMVEEVPQPEPEVQIRESLTVAEKSRAEPASKTVVASEKTTRVDTSLDQGTVGESTEPKWVLQLASFSVRKNADALSARLKEMGYRPMIETSSSTGKLIYRVRLQPVSDRNKLEQIARTLNKELELNAQILRYRP